MNKISKNNWIILIGVEACNINAKRKMKSIDKQIY